MINEISGKEDVREVVRGKVIVCLKYGVDDSALYPTCMEDH